MTQATHEAEAVHPRAEEAPEQPPPSEAADRAEGDAEQVSPEAAEPPGDAEQATGEAATGAGERLARNELKIVLESLVFVSEKPITPRQLGRATKTPVGEVREAVRELAVEYQGRGIELVEAAGGYMFRSAPASAPFVREFVAQRPVRLTRAQLETLAIIAYRQPVTRPEIEDVRGVDSGSALRVLLQRNLIKMLGRKDEPGRPLLYGTTPYFLEFFGMRGLKDLPTLREFTDLSDESRELFARKTGEQVEEGATNESDDEQRATLEDGGEQGELASASDGWPAPEAEASTSEAGSAPFDEDASDASPDNGSALEEEADDDGTPTGDEVSGELEPPEEEELARSGDAPR